MKPFPQVRVLRRAPFRCRQSQFQRRLDQLEFRLVRLELRRLDREACALIATSSCLRYDGPNRRATIHIGVFQSNEISRLVYSCSWRSRRRRSRPIMPIAASQRLQRVASGRARGGAQVGPVAQTNLAAGDRGRGIVHGHPPFSSAGTLRGGAPASRHTSRTQPVACSRPRDPPRGIRRSPGYPDPHAMPAPGAGTGIA